MLEKFLSNVLSYALISETSGPAITPELRKLYDEFPLPQSDEVPWCSLFIYWASSSAGYSTLPKKEKAPMARSWATVGASVKDPMPGDIVVMKRGQNPVSGHVGVFCRFDGDYVVVLGGNQANQVNFARYPKTSVLTFRRLS